MQAEAASANATPKSAASANTWNNAMFGGSQPSTPGSLSALGAEKSTPNVLFNLNVLENPAYSAEAKPLPLQRSDDSVSSDRGSQPDVQPAAAADDKLEVPIKAQLPPSSSISSQGNHRPQHGHSDAGQLGGGHCCHTSVPGFVSLAFGAVL